MRLKAEKGDPLADHVEVDAKAFEDVSPKQDGRIVAAVLQGREVGQDRLGKLQLVAAQGDDDGA